MCNSTYKILEKIAEAREMPMSDFFNLFPKKFNDHRDFYMAASLFVEGFIDCVTRHSRTNMYENVTFSKLQSQDIAIQLHIWSLGEGEQTYKGITTRNRSLDKLDPVFVTAKTDLFFEERKQKRIDFILTLFVGILIALVSSIATAYFAAAIK